VILDDADRDGQAEAGAAGLARGLVGLLGRIERLEDAIAILLGMPTPVSDTSRTT